MSTAPDPFFTVPHSNSLKSDAAKFLEIVEELNNKVPDAPVTSELNKHVMKLFSKTCTGDLCPMQAVIGGIAAQEVMKVRLSTESFARPIFSSQAITGKFMPIRQFLYFDAIECLPEDIYPAPDANATTSPPINHPTVPTEKSRYFSQEVVFGSDFQHKLGKAKYFIVSEHQRFDPSQSRPSPTGWFRCDRL